ncbi:hypothetical protein ARSEF4850_006531 [Beauveria asiatica]
MPEKIVRWTEAFCSDRTASLPVNGQESDVQDLPQAGLPQGSPLSPIAYLFFNADLVQRKIDANGGSIAFIDDFTAWVTGPTAQSNLDGIQSIVEHAADWERRSGATFQAKKTAIMHFTRNARKLDTTPILIKGEHVQPKEYTRILGVMIDTRLKFRQHIAEAASTGLEAAMELKRLRGLSARTARQLFAATVTPIVDYASNVWMHAYKDRLMGPINRVQRAGAQAIVGTFMTVATSVAEAEAHIVSARERFWKRAIKIELQRIKSIAEKNLPPGTRVLRDEYYPIKIDGVSRSAILDEHGKELSGLNEALGSENATDVTRVTWLSHRFLKPIGSVVIFLKRATDAARFLREGYFYAGGLSDAVIAGDFNRHDQLWGGDDVSWLRQGEGDDIINLMNDLTLSSLLPRGTKTWQGGDYESGIDLALASGDLAANMIKCATLKTDHGSDHQAIEAVFDVTVPEQQRQERLLLKNAPWKEIRTKIAQTLENMPSEGTVQQMTDRLMFAVCEAVHTLTPKAKPSSVAKRWWTEDLTQLRRIYTHWRNKARSARRAGCRATALEDAAKSAAKQYHDAIRQQKKSHWNELLADNDNIWQVAKYLKSGQDAAFGRVPQLRKMDGSHTTTDKDRAQELLTTFFPPLPDNIEEEVSRPLATAVPMPELTMEEIERQLNTAKDWKAPGQDGLPTAVWKQVWPVVKDRVFALFQSSLREGTLPSQWLHAKIIPLKKSGKEDYTAANAWRPISLLATLGKILESVIAERLSYVVEVYGLLPTNHFGARKKRSRQIDANGGAIAFVDDFTAWVAGPTALLNHQKIQSIIDNALAWERRSGATFDIQKTAIIHFTKNARKLNADPFIIKDQVIYPKDHIKILGLIMDTRLKYKPQIARAASKGLRTALELTRFKGLTAATARRLFSATVAPAVDYASNIWMHVYRDRNVGPINRVQRVGAQAIVGTFLTVATSIAEAEASIPTARERFWKRAIKMWIDITHYPRQTPFTE